MKKQILSIATIALALVSCQKELIDPEQPKIEISTFSASIENTITKTTIDDSKVLWEAGDAISINCEEYAADKEGAQANFTAVKGEAEGKEFHAFYPFGIQSKDNVGVLPETQTYCGAGKIGNLPMYAYSTEKNLIFYNICSVFAVKVTEADIDLVTSITVLSDDKATSGEFTVDTKDYTAVLTDPSNIKNYVTLDCGKGVAPGKDGTIFYIAIPAQTYTNIKVIIGNGETYKTMTTKVNQITTFVNTIYPMNFLLEGSSVLLDAPYIDEIL